MGSFYDVTAGNATLAADVNQYADRLNGTTGAQAKLLSQNNATSALQALLSSAPTGDQSVWDVLVAGDANARVAAYIRSADGYGGVRAGAGPGAATAHLYAQNYGWYVPEAFVVGGAITGGSLWSTSGIHSTGGVVFDNGAFTSDSAGHVTVVSAAVTQTVILAAGHQETGPCGMTFVAAAGSQGQGYFVRFASHMTNTPTSITLTNTGGQGNNAAAPTATHISNDGFLFFLSPTAAGTCFWFGTYTTVGN